MLKLSLNYIWGISTLKLFLDDVICQSIKVLATEKSEEELLATLTSTVTISTRATLNNLP